LAERIGIRDIGNKPCSGDRMYYAYIVNANKKSLQGEKIETPDFIKQNNLKLDYAHYISSQIMKPLLQLYALNLENMNEFKKKRGITLQSWYNEIDKLKTKWPEQEKFDKKLEEFIIKFDLTDPLDLANKLMNYNDLIKKHIPNIEKAYEYFMFNCNDLVKENILRNIISEYKYLSQRWV
jgi:hypothetical protein